MRAAWKACFATDSNSSSVKRCQIWEVLGSPDSREINTNCADDFFYKIRPVSGAGDRDS